MFDIISWRVVFKSAFVLCTTSTFMLGLPKTSINKWHRGLKPMIKGRSTSMLQKYVILIKGVV